MNQIVLLIFSITLIYFTVSLNTNTIVVIEDYLHRRNQQVDAEHRHNLRPKVTEGAGE